MSENEAEQASSGRKFQLMLDIDLWTYGDLADVHKKGYYEIFLLFLEEERKREGGSNVPHRYFKIIQKHAPEEYKVQIIELAE